MSTIPLESETEASLFSTATLAPPRPGRLGLAPPADIAVLPEHEEDEQDLASELTPEEQKALWDAERERRFAAGLDWPTIIWIGLLHLGCIAAPFTFSWLGLGICAALAAISAVGITLGFHRFFTHNSFKTYAPVRWFLAFVGCMAGEGSVLYWVANHRKHHALSDKVGDPHSPLDGPWGGLWAHMFWLLPRMEPEGREAHIKHWAPDLLKDPVYRFVDDAFIYLHLACGAILGGLGYWLGGWELAASLVVWGMFVRLTYVLHTTWFVNSITHMIGYRNYETTDESTNNWWVAGLTFGEGWHNNHHAYPRMANHGHQWWEIDMTFWCIRAMQAVGLAWDVVDYKHKHARDSKAH
jgi:stearoyl-CoA desaturase (delta-9 desaturase)